MPGVACLCCMLAATTGTSNIGTVFVLHVGGHYGHQLHVGGHNGHQSWCAFAGVLYKGPGVF